jgi:outer membrane protein assembly factor BamB
MRRTLSLALIAALLGGAARAGEPTGWRTDGTGRYPDARPPLSWSPEKNVVWKTPMPKWGNASPVLAGDRIFVCAEPHLLLCVAAGDGKILWQRAVKLSDTWSEEDRKVGMAKMKETEELKKKQKQLEKDVNKAYAVYKKNVGGRTYEEYKKDPENRALKKRFKDLQKQQRDVEKQIAANARWAPAQCESTNGYTSATPVSDGKHVWVLLGTGVAACFDVKGERKWIRYVGRTPYAHGHSASPLLADGKLLVFVRKLTALEPLTGKTVWTLDPSRTGWGTPCVTRLGKTTVAVTSKGQVVRISDGKALASGIGYLEYASPLVAGGVAYHPETKARATKLELAEDGTLKTEKLWKLALKKDRYYASPLLHEGLLYVLSRYNTFYVIDAAKGEILRTEKLPLGKGTNYTSVTLAGKHIHLANDNGTTMVITPGKDYEVVATNKLEYSRSTPVFRDKRMYVRTWKTLYCIGQ